MIKIGSSSGIGTLLRGSEELFEVSYTLDIFNDGHLKFGAGTLLCDPPDRLFLEAAKPEHALRLRSGDEMKIAIDTANMQRATFKSSGPIPGF